MESRFSEDQIIGILKRLCCMNRETFDFHA